MFDDIKRDLENARALLALDEQVVDALFTPATEAGVFKFAGSPWRDPANRHRTDAFIDQLLPLSEFYQEVNPPLSAAILGVWNAVTYLRRQRSLRAILRASKKTNEDLFAGVRGLIATAAIQFSDGNASTVVTSDAMSNLETYRKYVEKAIHNLSAVMPK